MTINTIFKNRENVTIVVGYLIGRCIRSFIASRFLWQLRHLCCIRYIGCVAYVACVELDGNPTLYRTEMCGHQCDAP